MPTQASESYNQTYFFKDDGYVILLDLHPVRSVSNSFVWEDGDRPPCLEHRGDFPEAQLRMGLHTTH